MKVKSLSKFLSGVIALSLIITTMSACGSEEDKPNTEKTSLGTNMYVDQTSKSVVNSTGTAVNGYTVNEDGDIVDKDGNIYITAENTAYYIAINSIKIDGDDDLRYELSKHGNTASAKVDSEKYTIPIIIGPDDYSYGRLKVTLENSDVAVLDDSGGYLVPGTSISVKGSKYEATMQAKDGKIEIVVECLNAGTATLTVESADGREKESWPITVTTVDVSSTDTSQTGNGFVGTQPVYTSEIDGWINGNKVNLRENANSESRILTTLKMNTEVKILGVSNGWVHVRVVATNQEGYILSSYIETNNTFLITATPAPTPVPTPTVNPEIPDDVDEFILPEVTFDPAIIG